MAEYLIQDTTLIGIADGVRDISGETSQLSPSGMTTELNGVSEEASDQNEALNDLLELLESKQKGEPTLIEKAISANGTYNASDDDVDGFSKVVANVPPTPTQSKTLTLGANAPETVTPDSGYALSSVLISLDTSVIKAENIAKNVKILGITGSHEGSGERKARFVKTTFTFGNMGPVAYGNGKFVATTSANTTTAAYSTDGINWRETTMPSASNWKSVTYGNGKFVAVASTSDQGAPTDKAAYSTDGINWTETTMPSASNWRSVTYGNGKFVAVGYYTTWPSKKNPTTAYSSDGINWTEATLPKGVEWMSIAYGKGVFVALSGNTSRNEAAYSTDGINWTATTMPSSAPWGPVAYGNGKFVATTSTNTTTAAYSTDGINWTATTMPSITANGWQSITYGNGMFFASATYADTAAYSIDGINWTTATMPLKVYWRSTAYGNGIFVVTGDSGNVAYCDTRCTIV